MLVSMKSAKSRLIEPSGVGRSHSATPVRIEYVASVAMIDDSPRTFVSTMFASPTTRQAPMTASIPRMTPRRTTRDPGS